MYKTKGQILDQLNGTNAFVTIEPKGPTKKEEAEMPILLVLKAIAQAQELTPGQDCEITDFVVKADSVSLTYTKGEFEKTNNVIPDRLAELFTDGRGPARFDE